MLYLKKAHSAVFDVRKLRSVVIRRERPERKAPGEGEPTTRTTPGTAPAPR